MRVFFSTKKASESSLNYNPQTYVPPSPGSLNQVPDKVRELAFHKKKEEPTVPQGKVSGYLGETK
jgi:hypothetical protein